MEILNVTLLISYQICKDKTNKKNLELTKLLSSNEKDFHMRKNLKRFFKTPLKSEAIPISCVS